MKRGGSPKRIGSRRNKPNPSAHQKDMRFFTVLFVIVSVLFANLVIALIFWALNR